MGKEAAQVFEEQRLEQALREVDEEMYGKPKNFNSTSKKKVKRIQWNTPFNFTLIKPKVEHAPPNYAFSVSSREEVIYLQRKEALAVPTSTKYRPRDVQHKTDKGTIRISNTSIGREKNQVFLSPCVSSLDPSNVNPLHVKPEFFEKMKQCE